MIISDGRRKACVLRPLNVVKLAHTLEHRTSSTGIALLIHVCHPYLDPVPSWRENPSLTSCHPGCNSLERRRLGALQIRLNFQFELDFATVDLGQRDGLVSSFLKCESSLFPYH